MGKRAAYYAITLTHATIYYDAGTPAGLFGMKTNFIPTLTGCGDLHLTKPSTEKTEFH